MGHPLGRVRISTSPPRYCLPGRDQLLNLPSPSASREKGGTFESFSPSSMPQAGGVLERLWSVW